jgi:hypothetical protein
MDREFFREALEDAGVKDFRDNWGWAQERGGFCDCELLLNAMRG